MEIIFNFIILIFAILRARYFYKKREGWWLVAAVCNVVMYAHLILAFFAEK